MLSLICVGKDGCWQRMGPFWNFCASVYTFFYICQVWLYGMDRVNHSLDGYIPQRKGMDWIGYLHIWISLRQFSRSSYSWMSIGTSLIEQ